MQHPQPPRCTSLQQLRAVRGLFHVTSLRPRAAHSPFFIVLSTHLNCPYGRHFCGPFPLTQVSHTQSTSAPPLASLSATASLREKRCAEGALSHGPGVVWRARRDRWKGLGSGLVGLRPAQAAPQGAPPWAGGRGRLQGGLRPWQGPWRGLPAPPAPPPPPPPQALPTARGAAIHVGGAGASTKASEKGGQNEARREADENTRQKGGRLPRGCHFFCTGAPARSPHRGRISKNF